MVTGETWYWEKASLFHLSIFDWSFWSSQQLGKVFIYSIPSWNLKANEKEVSSWREISNHSEQHTVVWSQPHSDKWPCAVNHVPSTLFVKPTVRFTVNKLLHRSSLQNIGKNSTKTPSRSKAIHGFSRPFPSWYHFSLIYYILNSYGESTTT